MFVVCHHSVGNMCNWICHCPLLYYGDSSMHTFPRKWQRAGKESRKKSIFTQNDESYYLCDDWWGCFDISNNRCTENCCQNHFDRHFGCLLVTHYWNWINENIRCIHVCECITDVWFIVLRTVSEQGNERWVRGGGRRAQLLLECFSRSFQFGHCSSIAHASLNTIFDFCALYQPAIPSQRGTEWAHNG